MLYSNLVVASGVGICYYGCSEGWSNSVNCVVNGTGLTNGGHPYTMELRLNCSWFMSTSAAEVWSCATADEYMND
ncbi:hypothetical protein MKW98_019924 [Papaver atlanticum]|uniref:Uncharacterized protein n=1 Tax=Papaver atlanticum TaxID=357466 RepID=A0AAD4X5Z7_9MAGN|nr:hypothetical protein MKW98_019924 [Papaver atlanticum]